MPKCPNCNLKMIESMTVHNGWFCWGCNFVYVRKGSRFEVVGEGKNKKEGGEDIGEKTKMNEKTKKIINAPARRRPARRRRW